MADPAPEPVDRPADVRLEGVSKQFGEVVALRPTDLSVYHGEFFSLLGSSGSGKTTTLRLIAGFEQPTTGRVLLQGEDVTGLAPYERQVNTVFQDYALFPHMSVEENVAYGLRVKGVKRAEIKRRVAEALDLVRLSGFGRRRPSQLSGGQRQRVALARALVNMPAVLLLDEPLGALDLKLRREMQMELKRIQRDVGITFVYVTHDQEEAMSMSDRIGVMSDGQLVQVGAPEDVYEHPASAFVAGFVGVSNLIGGVARDAGIGRWQVVTANGIPVLVKAPPDRAAGEEVLVTVRPEKIQLHHSAEGGENLLRGAVSDVSYGGAFTRYTVQSPVGEMVVMAQNTVSGPVAARGEEVWLSWPAAQAYVLPGTSADVERGRRAQRTAAAV